MAETAHLESVGAACRLSGLRIDDNEVPELLRGRGRLRADVIQAQGYARALQERFASAGRPLGWTDFARLNAVAIGALDRTAVSPWRTTALVREGFSETGQAIGRVYSTLPPREIDPCMNRLVGWLNAELQHPARHPVPAIATFVLGLLAASPFESANGRTAFLAAGHLLRRAGYEHVAFSSLEKQIEALRTEFHESFDHSATRFWSGSAEIAPWLSFFSQVLDRQRERLDVQLALNENAQTLPPLQAAILNTVRENGTVSAGLLIEKTGANRNTLKDNLRRLVERGQLERMGERRAAKYRLAPPSVAPDDQP